MSDRFVDSSEDERLLRNDERSITLHDSTRTLPELLRQLLLVRPHEDMDDLYARFWRDALVIVLRYLGRIDKKQHEQLARILTAELLVMACRVTGSCSWTGVPTHPNVAMARSMAQGLKKLLHRSYSRGTLKPIDSQAPWLLRGYLLTAEKALDPLTRPGAETLWRELSQKRFPAVLWYNLKAAKGARFRAKVFVAAVNGCSPDSLNRTLQRSHQRLLRGRH